jgi:hypothetical protein
MVSAASSQIRDEPTEIHIESSSLERRSNTAAAARMSSMPRVLVDTHDTVWTDFLAGIPLNESQSVEIAASWMEPSYNAPVINYSREPSVDSTHRKSEAAVMLTGLGGGK